MKLAFVARSLITASALAVSTMIAPAAAAVITFGDISGLAFDSNNPRIEAGYSMYGFGLVSIFTGTGGCMPGCASNGTPYAAMLNSYAGGSWSASLTVTAQDSSLFRLLSFDGAEAPFNNQFPNFWASGIQVTGTRADNTTVTVSYVLDQFNDGAVSTAADFQAFSGLAGEFRQVRFVGIAGRGRDFAVDNIALEAVVVNAVPEPASLELLGLALVGLAATKKRKQA